jgi:hypothetical protein
MPMSCFDLVEFHSYPIGCLEGFADFVEFKNAYATKWCSISLLLQALAVLSAYLTLSKIKEYEKENVNGDVGI